MAAPLIIPSLPIDPPREPRQLPDERREEIEVQASLARSFTYPVNANAYATIVCELDIEHDENGDYCGARWHVVPDYEIRIFHGLTLAETLHNTAAPKYMQAALEREAIRQARGGVSRLIEVENPLPESAVEAMASVDTEKE